MDLVVLLSTLTVILCLCALFLFILRIQHNLERETVILKSGGKNTRPMMAMSKVCLPFSINIIKSSGEEIGDVRLNISGSGKCFLTYFSCVAIKELQKVLNPEYRKDVTKKKTLESSLALLSLYSSKVKEITLLGNESPVTDHFSITSLPVDICEKVTEINNQSNQQFLPVVLLLNVSQNVCEAAGSNETIISMMTSFSTRPNTKDYEISSQYIETVDHRIYPLKKLFESGVQLHDDTPTMSNESNELCVICHHNSVTRVLMPCGHSCCCKACFQKLNACPICRVRVQSYFVISDESAIPLTEEEERDIVRQDIQNMGFWNFIKSVWNAG